MSRFGRWLVCLSIAAFIVGGLCPLTAQQRKPKPGAVQDSLNADFQRQLDSLKAVNATQDIRLFALGNDVAALYGLLAPGAGRATED